MISNINFERAIISTLLFDSRSFHSIQEHLTPSDFVDPMTSEIFKLVETKIAIGETMNDTIAMHELPNFADAIASDISGLPALDLKTLISLSKQVNDLSKRRQIIAVLHTAVEEVKEGRVFDLSALNEIDRGTSTFVSNEEHIAIMEDRIMNKRTSADTGIPELDAFLTTAPGDTIVIAARPSMGKTSLVSTFIWSFLDQGEGSLFLSLEMAADKIMSRMISARAGEPVSNINRNSIINIDKVNKTKDELKNTGLFEISDVPMDESQIEHYVKQRVRMNPKIKHVFLDHLTFTKDSGKYKNEHLRIGGITKAFKNLAKELGIRFWMLSQLSRSIESRPNKRPQLSDLRESGAIEENADIVMFIYRESYYIARETGEKEAPVSDAEIGVGKNRDGPTNTAKAQFNGPLVRFQAPGAAVYETEYVADDMPIDIDVGSPSIEQMAKSVDMETGEVSYQDNLPGLPNDMSVSMPLL